MAEWMLTMVEDRLESAAEVFRSLPEVKPQGYFNAWPEYFHSFADQVGQEARSAGPSPGSGTSRRPRRRCCGCAGWSPPKLVWARSGRPEAVEADLLGAGDLPATADRRLEYGIAVIVWRLNGRRVPTKRSMEFVVRSVAKSFRWERSLPIPAVTDLGQPKVLFASRNPLRRALPAAGVDARNNLGF